MENETFQEEEIFEENVETTTPETDNEQVDNTQEEETVETEESSEDVESLKQRLEKIEAENKKLYGRLKRDNKKEKKEEPQDDEVDLKIEFFTKGHNREDLLELNKVMRGTGKDFTEAQADPLFTAYIEKKETERKDAQAGINSKRGAPARPTVERDMDRDDHKELWKKATGN